MTQIERLREIIDNSEYLVFFGGAGVSTASGIPDFRSSNGIYNEKYGNIPIERIISHSFFMSNPEIFFKIYKEKLVFKISFIKVPVHIVTGTFYFFDFWIFVI